jgi:hypothetical protein
MKRLTIIVSVVVLVLGIGAFIWITHEPVEPLSITISEKQPPDSKVPFEHFTVTIKNVSRKTVRGYSLGSTCNCYSWDEDDKRYPLGINFSNPNPERPLGPGESQQMFFEAETIETIKGRPIVWVDLVHFEHGSNWGPNQSHKDGYVRTY